MAHLMQIHKSITTLQGEDIVFLATDINLPGLDILFLLAFTLCSSPRCCRLGHDAILLWSPLHAGLRKTRKI